MCADLAEDTGEIVGVVVAEWGEEEPADGFNVSWEYRSEDVPAGTGDADDGAAFIIGRRGAGDQAALLERLCLIGQAAAAVDHSVSEVGHTRAAVYGVTQACQELELDVAQSPDIAQLLLDGGAQKTAYFREGEVRA